MLGLAAIPSLIQSVGFLFAPESPRWLVRKGRLQEARLAFTKLRSKTSDIEAEFEAIRVHCSLPDAKTPDNDEVHDVSSTSQAKQPKSHNPSLWHVLRHEKAVRQALLVGCVLQLVQQLAGINTIM